MLTTMTRIAVLMMLGVCRPVAALDIRGQVSGPHAEPIAGATVELETLLPAHLLAARQLAGDFAPDVVATRQTSQDGAFLLAAPTPGFWRIVVRHPEYLPASFDLSPLVSDFRLPDLALQRRSELVTRWLDADDQPLAGLHFVARGWSTAWKASSREGWWPADRWSRTRDDGLAAMPCESEEKVSIAVLTRERFLFEVVDCNSGLIELRLTNTRQRARIVHANGEPAETVYGFIRWPFLAFGRTAEDGLLTGPFDWQETVPIVVADATAFYGEPRRLHPEPKALELEGEHPESNDLSTTRDSRPEPPTLELPATYDVTGQVIDRIDQRKIADAFLWVGRGSHFFQTLGQDGEYELQLPAGSEMKLGFGAPGYLPVSYRQSKAGEMIARLTPEVSVSGRVVDVLGNGVASASISSPKSPAHGLSAHSEAVGHLILAAIEETTSADGSFELRGLVPGRTLELRVTRLGFAVHHQALALPKDGGALAEVVITLERGYDGFGQVVNDHDLPLAGAEVSLLPALTGSAFEQNFEVQENFGATTNAEGHFQLHDLPLGTYYLAAKSPGFPEYLVPGVEIVESAEPIDLGTLVLVPGILLSGRVVDRDEKPIPGAQLSIRNADGEQIVVQRAGSPWFASTVSRQNGSFHLDGLPRDRRLTMVVSADHYLPQTLPVTTGEDNHQLTVELVSGAQIVGQVLEPSGGSASGASVQANATGSNRRFEATSKSVFADADGRFEITGLRPGEYEVTAHSTEARANPVLRDLRGATMTEVVLQLEPRATIEVAVTDHEGVPVGGAGVRSFALESTPTSGSDRRAAFRSTDRSGLATIGPLDPGSYSVKAMHPDFETVETTVEIVGPVALSLGLSFEQQRDLNTYRASGRVIDEAGLPVVGARLSLVGTGSFFATSGPDGSFEMTAPGGEYRLTCQHADFPTQRSGPIDLTTGDVSDLLVELAEGVAVVGRVTGLDTADLSQLVSQLVVVARGPLSEEGGGIPFGQHYGSINSEGEFRIPGLQAGEWVVRAELLNPKRAASERVEISPAAGEVRVDLHFETGYRLTGGVFLDGAPVVRCVVVVRCPGEFRAEVFVDAEGRFSIDNVPAEKCLVRASDSDRGLETKQELVIAFDSDIVLELE